jgi:hypothetical protein
MQKSTSETCLNVYYDTRTGQQRMLWPRSRSGARWEREEAIPNDWWNMGHLKPLYMIRVTPKK